MGRLLRHCRILHHYAASGYVDQGDDRENSIGRILDMIERLDVDSRQILAAIEGRAVTPVSPGNTPLASLSQQTLPAIYPFLSLGAVAGEDELDLISRWVKENEIGVRGVYQARLDMAKFVKLIEHDDATRVIPEDIIRFKEHLGSQGLSSATINRYLSAIKSPLAWALRNRKIGSNPGVGIVYNAKGKKRIKRRGYDDNQARPIPLAAREEELAHRRWIPWVCAFTGYRLDEVAGRDVRDVQQIGKYWVLDIPDGKTDGSARKIPLHSALIREGFIEYVKSLPPNGPLFPDLTPDLHGRRAGSATKRIGRWLRQVQKRTGVLLVEEPRFAPNHSWRHRFKSEARRVGMDEEVHDALTGHREGKVSRDYGEYYVEAVLGPAIESILSPFDIRPAHTAAENPQKAAWDRRRRRISETCQQPLIPLRGWGLATIQLSASPPMGDGNPHKVPVWNHQDWAPRLFPPRLSVAAILSASLGGRDPASLLERYRQRKRSIKNGTRFERPPADWRAGLSL
jgi:integrase